MSHIAYLPLVREFVTSFYLETQQVGDRCGKSASVEIVFCDLLIWSRNYLYAHAVGLGASCAPPRKFSIMHGYPNSAPILISHPIANSRPHPIRSHLMI